MIPILYQGTETSFTNNGIGRLSDAISCKVTEELNGSYELEMQYPITGIHYTEICDGMIILAKPFDGGTTQPFIVYKMTKPINGIVTINAEHISYRLTGIPVMPFTAASLAGALVGIKSNSAITNPFTFSTDISSAVSFSLKSPRSCRNVLGGEKGSILDVFNQGDFEFNRFEVILRGNRGSDNNVTLRYGKNITDLKNVVDMTSVYTGICPYWTDGESTVTLTEKVILSDHVSDFPFTIIKTVDFSGDFESAPSQEQLRTKAQSYVTSNQGWKLSNKITVSFVNLYDTEEYKNVAVLERVKMCDQVNVLYESLGVNFKTRVVKTEYDVLLERYNKITLGENSYSFGKVVQEQIAQSEAAQTTHMERALKHATELLRGGLGGYVVLKPNANGQPEEILIMDQPDIAQAVNVIRMNMGGIGFSRNGYDPDRFVSAWTIDGHFVADFIDTGTLTADIIRAGILADDPNGTGVSFNSWNLETGEFRLSYNTKVKTSNGSLYGIANTHDVSTAKTEAITAAGNAADTKIQAYDNETLNQQRVFEKLFKTNEHYNQGVVLTNGNLYLSATYIKSGALEVGGNNNMVGSITLKNASNKVLGIWNNSGITMYNGTHAADALVAGDITGSWDANGIDVKKGSIAGSAIKVGGGNNQGKDGSLYVYDAAGNEIGHWNSSGISITAGEIQGPTIKGSNIYVGGSEGGSLSIYDGNTLIGSWGSGGIAVYKGSIAGPNITVGGNNNGNGVIIVNDANDQPVVSISEAGIISNKGTITGNTIIGAAFKTADAGERIEMDTSSSLKGYNAGGLHNLINMMQTGTTQMTIDADTQLNIRTPSVYVTDSSAGTGSATVYGTQTDSLADFQNETLDTGRLCYRILDVRKLMPSDDPNDEYKMREIEIKGVGTGQGDVRCTLPVFLKFRFKNERRMHGMVLSGTTAQSFVV